MKQMESEEADLSSFPRSDDVGRFGSAGSTHDHPFGTPTGWSMRIRAGVTSILLWVMECLTGLEMLMDGFDFERKQIQNLLFE